MLDIILQILSILGIVLLILLGVALVLLLLVLFFPITYKFYGSRSEDIVVKFKASWLLGFGRIHYSYPENATLCVKVLWHTIYCKKIPQEGEDTDKEASEAQKDATVSKSKPDLSKGASETPMEESIPVEAKDLSSCSEDVAISDVDNSISPEESTENATWDEQSSNKILQKIEKIKYTIRNIYDKIKDIWENITYYVELLKEENTKVLFRHVTKRIGKIWKSIRPRHLEADVVFGTGSPDTTGYVYGVYGILSAAFGKDVLVEPDFEQAVLKGEVQLSGHITVWVLVINALKLFFDPKLHLFIEKVKAGMPKKEK